MSLFMRYAVELAIVVPDAVFIFLPVWENLRWRPWAVVCASGVLLPSFVLSAAWLGAEGSWPMIPILVAEVTFLFLLFFFSVKISLGKKLFCFFNSIMLGAFCLLYSIAVTIHYDTGNDLWYSLRLLSLRGSAAALGLSLIAGLVFFRALTVELPTLMRDERLGGIWDFLFLIPLGVLLIICWMVPIQPKILLVGRSRDFILLLLPLLPMVVLLLYHLLWWVAVRFSESARAQQENTMLQMENKRYEGLQRYMEKTRTLRHDFHNHLLVINEFARTGQTEKLLEYLAPLIQTAGSYVGYSQNSAVDAVASHYAGLASAQETTIDWRLQLPAVLPVREPDYCAMLGNLLENALNAVRDLPAGQRRVTVISSMLSDEMLGLAVDNPFKGKIVFGTNGLPRSGRPGHGVGLTSVRNIVRHYNGSMNITTENGVFSVEILLYMLESRKEEERERVNKNLHQQVFMF